MRIQRRHGTLDPVLRLVQRLLNSPPNQSGASGAVAAPVESAAVVAVLTNLVAGLLR